LLPSLPKSLIESLQDVKGFNEESFMRIHASGEQVTAVRLNPKKKFDIQCSLLNVENNVPWCPFGRYLTERPSFTLDPLLHAGAYYVQDASSMFLWHVLQQTIGENTSGLKVLDLCGAPGGKSTLLASYFKDGLIVANEVIKTRASILTENITKWGSANVVVTNNDPRDFKTLEGFFDMIVVDAPCSGSGLFRKDTEAINEWSEENVLLCSQRQQRILADILPSLKKDGILVYSTCSYSVEEDEDILDWIMKEFAVDSLRLPVEENWNIVETVSAKKAYGYRFYPDKIKGEGFFIAAFRKGEAEGKENHLQAPPAISKTEAEVVKSWIKNSDELFCFKQGENIIAVSAQWKFDIALLQKKLYLRKAGITAGILKGKDMVPDHELALSLLVNEKIPAADLSYDDAVQYLKKRELALGDLPKGWVIVRYCGITLGWIKVLHNRLNNYYPVNWRILKD